MMEVFLIVVGFILGSIMFCEIIPLHFCNIDLAKISEDNNPGAFNTFKYCGAKIGFVCLLLDVLKGFVPTILASFIVGSNSIAFGIIMLAPILGHAIGLFNKGGKCIATTFGVMFGIIPVSYVVVIIASLYIFFSIVLRKHLFLCSLITYFLFGILSVTFCRNKIIGISCLLISIVVIYKHLYSKIRKHEYELAS